MIEGPVGLNLLGGAPGLAGAVAVAGAFQAHGPSQVISVCGFRTKRQGPFQNRERRAGLRRGDSPASGWATASARTMSIS